ncbi:MAG: hypothetical protein ACHQF0_16270 [Chitinophagales bacterium]
MKIKDRHARESSFSRALIAGLICGIIAAILIVIYTVQYRRLTGFKGLSFIEPSIIFIAVPLLLTCAGFVFLGMVELSKRGELFFIFLALLLTLGAIAFDLFFKEGPVMSGVKGLLLGIEAIAGLIISFLLPFLGTHPKIFMEKEELLESAQ